MAPAAAIVRTGTPSSQGYERQQGSSWVRRPHFGAEQPRRRQELLAQRLPSDDPSGRRVPVEGGAGALLAQPDGVTSAARRESLRLVRALNEVEHERLGDPQSQTRISAYELAYRVQTSVPELTDIALEPAKMHEMYGTENAVI